MGERGARNEPATPEDIAAMAAIVKAGVEAGALGFSTSRTLAHRAIDGEPVPGTFAAEDELFGIGQALGELGTGVFELAPAGILGEDLAAPEREMDWMQRLSAAIQRPVTFALSQNNADPDSWRRLLDLSADAAARGPRRCARRCTAAPCRCSSASRPSTHSPSRRPGARPASASSPGGSRWRASQADPDLAARIVADARTMRADPMISFMRPSRIYVLGDPPVYEPGPERSARAIAEARGVDEWEMLLELLLGDGGRELLNAPVLNYTNGNLDAVGEMLQHPTSAFGLGDGGAHAGQTCDASTTTFLLTHWSRDRDHGRLTVEQAVHKMTQATATLYGLGDRGVLAPGFVGDANVIDYERLQLRRPELVSDLPGGASRLVQQADGYLATIKSGVRTFVEGDDTGARPGALLRGAR